MTITTSGTASTTPPTTPTNNLLPMTRIPSTATADITKFVDITCKAFDPAPLLNGFVCEQDNIPPPYPVHIPWDRRREHFAPGLEILAANPGAELVHAGDWSALAVWQTPTYTGPQFGETRKRQSPLTIEFRRKFNEAERKWLGVVSSSSSSSSSSSGNNNNNNNNNNDITIRPCYYLAFLARNPDLPSVPGAISAVMTPYLQRAREENVPAWVEAATRYSEGIYQHYGFRTVGQITLGQGRNGPDGWPLEGGEGVSVWIMVYDQHLEVKCGENN